MLGNRGPLGEEEGAGITVRDGPVVLGRPLRAKRIFVKAPSAPAALPTTSSTRLFPDPRASRIRPGPRQRNRSSPVAHCQGAGRSSESNSTWGRLHRKTPRERLDQATRMASSLSLTPKRFLSRSPRRSLTRLDIRVRVLPTLHEPLKSFDKKDARTATGIENS